LREHKLLDSAVAKELEAAVEYAPLHLPASLAVLKATQEKLPGVPQAICLDTAFHRHMPEVSRTYALPEKIRKLGVERYGFHGLSLESIVAQLPALPDRLVVAHLGNGASITAILKGVSIDTSMGLTPTGGLIMGTRCGDLDPGLMVYLMRRGYARAEQLERVFDHESGLLGISGMTSDVRSLLEDREKNKQAALALEMFCYQVRKTVAGMAAALGGVDVLVFTGGIGEHASALRTEISHGLKFLSSIELDVRVLPSQEDEQIAKNTVRLLNAQS
jgi:acetate kinase